MTSDKLTSSEHPSSGLFRALDTKKRIAKRTSSKFVDLIPLAIAFLLGLCIEAHATSSEINLSSVPLGARVYNLEKGLQILSVSRAWEENINGKQYPVSYRITLAPSHNRCTHKKLDLDIDWIGLSRTAQPPNFKNFEMSVVERETFYFADSYYGYSGKALSIINKMTGDAGLQIDSNGRRIVDYRTLLEDFGLSPLRTHQLFSVIENGRILASIKRNEWPETNVVIIKYQAVGEYYTLSSAIDVKNRSYEEMNCAIRTLTEINELISDAHIIDGLE